MTALERAIASPEPVPGLGRRSPMHGLDRRSVGFADVLAQSVSAVAPSAAATTMPLLIAVVAGGASVWSLALSMGLALLIATTVNTFAKRIAATGSLYTFVAKTFGAGAAVVTGVGMLTGYGFIAMFALAGASYYLVILLGRVSPFLAASSAVAAGIVGILAAVVMLVLARGIRLSTRVTLLVELLSVVIILVLVVSLLVQVGPTIDWSVLSMAGATPATLSVGAVVALTAFVGFESSATLGAEAQRPYAAIPRAVVWTVIGAGALYLLASFSQIVGFASLGVDIRDSESPVNDLTSAFGLAEMGVLLDVSIVASFLACAIASTTALARVLFTMGREGLLPEAFGRAHATYRTPFTAILVAVPVIAVVPIIAVFIGDGLWRAMEVLLVVAAAGYITAYIVVCAAAPVFLRGIGEFTTWAGVRAGAASVLLTGVLAVYLVSEAISSRAVGVWVFLVVMLVGVVACRLRLRRRRWLHETIGAWDEPSAADVLGGSVPDVSRD
jgi:amino acid transporter